MTTHGSDYNHTVALKIEPRIGGDGLYVELEENGRKVAAAFPHSAGTEIALSVMKSTGWPSPEARPGTAAYARTQSIAWLGNTRDRMKSEAREARGQAKLECEALKLLNVHRQARMGHGREIQWDDVDSGARAVWIKVAEAAQEATK